MSKWTIDTLKEHFQILLKSNEKKIKQKFKSLQRAVGKAETASDKRFESVNEFRNTLADQSRTFIPRIEAESRFNSLERQIIDLKTELEKVKNIKAGSQVVWAYVIAAVSLMVAISGGIITFYTNFVKH